MKRIAMLSLCLMLAALLSTGADAKPKRGIDDKRIGENFEDAVAEVGEEKLTLRFSNALDGKPIPGADVTIDGVEGQLITDAEGKVLFPLPSEDGKKLVRFRKQGFVATDFPIEIAANSLWFNRFSISPTLDLAYVRIILDWDSKPADLDAHLIKKGEGGYHVSYRDMKTAKDGAARLDRDDTDGYGPETITITQVDAGAEYEFHVHDFSNRNDANSPDLSKSKATVKVYARGNLAGIYQVPRGQTGNTWRVFTIVNGEMKIKDDVIGR